MAIDQGLVSSFKAEVLLGVHDFRASGGDTFKIALYTSSATLNANTTAYSATNEVSGTGYSAGGATLTSLGVSTDNTSTTVGGGYVDFSDVTWASSTITARGALIYNSTPSANSNSGASLTNPAVAVIDFGSDKTTSGTTFRITFPAGNFTNAIIRTE